MLEASVTGPGSPCRPPGALPSSPAWTPGSTRQGSRASPRATRTSSATPAGGRASDDAIRSLVISYKLLGTREWFVVHHTDCGMETFTDAVMRRLLRSSLETANRDADGWRDAGQGSGSGEADFIDWMTIDDQPMSVAADVRRLRQHPLVPRSIPIHGYLYDVRTGRLNEVSDATAIGRPA
jgi:carbonic anhydrase